MFITGRAPGTFPGVFVYASERVFIFSVLFDQDNGKDAGCAVSDRSGIHHALNTHKQWKDDDKRHQEDDLPCHGKENTLCSFSDRGKEIGGYRLQTVKEGTKQVNPKEFYCKGVIQFLPISEQADDLPRKYLKTENSEKGYNCCGCGSLQICFLHALIILRTVVEADDWLSALG